MLLTTVSLLVLISGVTSQCTGNDHPSCASWKNNGYCSNSDKQTVKKYCGVSCGLCNTDGSQTAAGGGSTLTDCVDANANCANWVATNNFCARTDYSNSMKLLYCCKTCRPVVFATTTTTVAGVTDATTEATTSQGKHTHLLIGVYSMLLTTVSLLVLVSGVASQCTGNDHPSCASWKNNGYCSNSDKQTVKKYCGVSCGLCNTDGSQTAAGGGSTLTDCVDANANCANWVATNNFCARTDYSNSMKLLYCCKTCRPVVFATTTTTVAGVTDATTEATTS
ncbi:hypothetical protein PENTCL1PPCAC_1968, partial [Pristionchus entomophagus]